MDEKISPAEFDILLHDKIAPQTQDEVIQEITYWLVDSYEDIGTNRLQSECEYWKFFNRLRLLLASDAEYRSEKFDERPQYLGFSRRTGLVFVLMLASVVFISVTIQSWAVFWGVGIPLHVLGGIMIFAALCYDGKPSAPNLPILYATYPFESFADLLVLRRSVHHFASKQFPKKSPIPSPSRNPVIRFLWDTKCPAWVDRVGDAFVQAFAWFNAFLWIIVLWPLLPLLAFVATQNAGAKPHLVFPKG